MKRSILFVCTGNVYRSVSAQHALRTQLKNQGIHGWRVSSAGTIARPQRIHPATIATLTEHGIHIPTHTQQKLTRPLLEEHDIIIAMDETHRERILSLDPRSIVHLYNELACATNEPITDVIQDSPTIEHDIRTTITHIVNTTPSLYRSACERYYLFTDFVNGNGTHRNGHPFLPLHETRRTLAFMSLDIPKGHESHILIIPKKRYARIEQIPQTTLNEMMASARLIGSALPEPGYNLLLNDGKAAGQYIYHSHIHLIPRTYRDGIRIEVWDKQHVSEDEFVRLSKKLIKRIRESQKKKSHQKRFASYT